MSHWPSLVQKSATLGNHEISLWENSQRYFKQGSDKPWSLLSWKVNCGRVKTIDTILFPDYSWLVEDWLRIMKAILTAELWRRPQHCLTLLWPWNPTNINFLQWIPLGTRILSRSRLAPNSSKVMENELHDHLLDYRRTGANLKLGSPF